VSQSSHSVLLPILMALGNVHCLDAQEAEPKPSPKMEYYLQSNPGEGVLESIGNQGWQLVQVIDRGNGSETYYFQRPKPIEIPIAAEIINKRTVKEWFEFAANARAKRNRELARKVLIRIAEQHEADDQRLSQEEQEVIRLGSLKLLATKDPVASKDAAIILRPFVDESCRLPLLSAAEEAISAQREVRQSQQQARLLEILKTLRPIADDSCIQLLASLPKEPNIGDTFRALKVIGSIKTPAAREALESISANDEYHPYYREVANVELDRMDFEDKKPGE
jgi:hypothetical protein